MNETLTGEITPTIDILAGDIYEDSYINGEISNEVIRVGEPLPEYDGDYFVIPRVESQTLNTTNKTMTADVTVDVIPISMVSNLSGGLTVNIG